MNSPLDYLEINRQSWNRRTAFHTRSEFYDLPGFLRGNCSLNEIELALLGDVGSKTLLHLQCHFGQDTLSLARRGAKVTGIDLSDAAIETARDLNAQLGLDARFIACNLYDLPRHLQGQFDVVFTSYGTIGWLPDLNSWAHVVSHFLRPGGQFVFVEFHPVVWMFDDDFATVKYRYFNSGPIVETESGTYADPAAPIRQQYVTWNHGIGEVLQSLLHHGLEIRHFREYDYSPYNCFRHTEQIAERKYRIGPLGDKIPLVYSLEAVKKGPTV
jgi:SAM-dependent methyltransferase